VELYRLSHNEYVFALLNELRHSDLQGENLMTHLRDVPVKELAALQFADAATFRRAARFAAEHKIRAEAPGRSTLIVRMSDKGLFENRGFKFRESSQLLLAAYQCE
jgi:hypothetical protein